MKRRRLFQGVLVTSVITILSGCQIKTVKSNQSVKESEEMTIEKKEINQSTSSQSKEEHSKTKESEMKTFPSGSLLQAVTDIDSAKVQEILQDKSYPIDEMNEKGETPLLIATHQNAVEIAKLLIDRGASINKQDQIFDSPYLYAGAQGKTEILAYMLEKQEPNQQIFNRFGGNALIPAAEKGHIENVKLLLADGRVKIDHQNNYGYTALIEAVALRDGSAVYQQIVKVLLEAGANKTLKDNTGRTAEDYARSLGYTEMLHLLTSN
ncbi:ankyrin repeat domain-containing protein [Candidatus Enterococcus mansonii]|uniref:Uncharacterized protein n=1 Tax=Candidatus Enterococcus mansonii TaxID=1834181 RepID=A0A242CI16_9ENTE|nr:ankyrin repeat domain-containing protein [Enterococcus sp. 4G2_DIV0659]OTO09877.1 hypothetical protein A5880_000560 [Enterococcus sp. 4G2_DIV0659]